MKKRNTKNHKTKNADTKKHKTNDTDHVAGTSFNKTWHELGRKLKQELTNQLEELCSNSGSLNELCEKLIQAESHKLRQYSSPAKSVNNDQKWSRAGVTRVWNKDTCVGEMEFATRDAFQTFLLVGKYPRHSSPCVDANLNEAFLEPEHSLVYEE